MVANDGRALLAAAQRGLGIAMLPEVLARDSIDTGRLIRVLPNTHGPVRELRLLFARDPGQRLRALIDFIVSALPI